METQERSPRIDPAAKAIGLTAEELEAKLKSMGLETEDFDDDGIFKFGDFREALSDKPIASVRKAYRALRGSKRVLDKDGQSSADARTQQLRELGFKVKVEDANLATLLPLYDPSLSNDAVTKALKSRFGDKPVIAFNNDGKVAVTETIGYAADLEQDLPEQEAIMVDGELSWLYPVGVVPDLILEEDPLFPGKPLRAGRSLVNHRNWQAVSHDNRQLVRIVVERGEIVVDDREAVLRLLERTDDIKRMQEAYPEAWLEFRSRKKAETLPTLRVTPKSANKNDPFGHRKY